MRELLAVTATLLLSSINGCGGPQDPTTCVPGSTAACLGAGGCMGVEVCEADGRSFSACTCGMDAGSDDAGQGDAEVIDATMPGDDAHVPDASVDAGPPDAGPPMCAPACDASTRCCGSTCVSRTGVMRGLDGRDDPSFANCNACGAGCDASAASACSVAAGAVMPSCMCGENPACSAPQTCELVPAGRFECRCGGAVCSFGEECGLVSGAPTCVDLDTDAMNCGVVGRACGPGQYCRFGRCTCNPDVLFPPPSECAPTAACCGAACPDTTSDEMNCGGCGVRCRSGETCTGGSCECGSTGRRCTPASGATALGEACCSGACVPNGDASCACYVCRSGFECRYDMFEPSMVACISTM